MKEYNALATKFIIPQRLKAIREDKKISQKQAASVLKICNSTLSQYENGKRKPSASVLMELSDLYQESIDCLLGKLPYPTKRNDQAFLRIIEIYPPFADLFTDMCSMNDEDCETVLKTIYPVFAACLKSQTHA